METVIYEVGPSISRSNENAFKLSFRRSSPNKSRKLPLAILGRLYDLVAPEIILAKALARFDVDEWRQIELSRQMANYVLDLSEKVESGDLKLHRLGRASNEEIIYVLTKSRNRNLDSTNVSDVTLGRLGVLSVGGLGSAKVDQATVTAAKSS